MTQTVILRSKEQRDLAKRMIDRAPENGVVKISEASEVRTIPQNSTLHMWFSEVARQQGDLDATEVKGMCHRRWGLVIRLRDPQFAWIWERSGAHLTYEKQCALLASGVLNVSSKMTPAELSEYMDAMSRHFRSDGINLTDPESRKYEGAI